MISSVHVSGYRGFEQFEMSALGRVNLLVGTNGSGKTSMLEALYLLSSHDGLGTLLTLLRRRGELEPAHMFAGHQARLGSTFTASARNESPERSIKVSIVEWRPELDTVRSFVDDVGASPPRLGLRIESAPGTRTTVVPLTPSADTGYDFIEAIPRRRADLRREPSELITTESLNAADLVSLWDDVALTPSEDLVLRALRIIEPSIERIAAQIGLRDSRRGGFIVKSKRHSAPVPIGSMGDGMWRMLAMAIAITKCAGGMLLVDEIDTGLHYSVMSDMWRLVLGAARSLDAQVFATTHSLDCIRSLAEVCVSETAADGHVTLQRIEPGRAAAIPYTESEIAQAAEHGIEVR